MDTKKPFWHFKMLSPNFFVVPIIAIYRHCSHIEKVTKENRDEKLMEHLMDCCDENLIDLLNDTEYIEKIESEVNNYINLYAICDDADFNWLM